MPTRVRALLVLAAVIGLALPAAADAAPSRTARWVDRWLGRPRGKRRMKLFLSELFWPTDHPNHEFNFWVERRTAASWLATALKVTRRWSRIYTLGWFSLYDDRPRPRGDEVNRGLLDRFGRKKPAYFAYRRG